MSTAPAILIAVGDERQSADCGRPRKHWARGGLAWIRMDAPQRGRGICGFLSASEKMPGCPIQATRWLEWDQDGCPITTSPSRTPSRRKRGVLSPTKAHARKNGLRPGAGRRAHPSALPDTSLPLSPKLFSVSASACWQQLTVHSAEFPDTAGTSNPPKRRRFERLPMGATGNASTVGIRIHFASQASGHSGELAQGNAHFSR